MTYDTNIQATEMEALPEFYDISYGATHERYTTNTTDLLFQLYTWRAAPIKRTSFTRDNDFSILTTTITTVPSELLRLYAVSTPMEPVKIVIYRALATDLSSYATLFSGLIASVQFSNGQVQVKCEAQSQHLKKRVPQYLYQAFCNHTLFDNGCGLHKMAYKTSGALTYVSGTTLKIAECASKADGYFDQGMIEIGSDKRLIIKHTTNTLIIHTAFDSRAIVGVVADCYPGCDKSPATCKAVFNNFKDHFLGHPYIPTRNPVLDGFK